MTDETKPAPFDPEALRIDQDFAALADVKPILATVPARKPNKQDYVRVHPSEDYQLTTALLELKEHKHRQQDHHREHGQRQTDDKVLVESFSGHGGSGDRIDARG